MKTETLARMRDLVENTLLGRVNAISNEINVLRAELTVLLDGLKMQETDIFNPEEREVIEEYARLVWGRPVAEIANVEPLPNEDGVKTYIVSLLLDGPDDNQVRVCFLRDYRKKFMVFAYDRTVTPVIESDGR